MKLKFILVALAPFLVLSCTYNKPQIEPAQEDTFIIEEEQDMVEQGQDNEYEVVLDEEQAEKMNEEAEANQPVIKDEVVEIQDRVFFSYNSSAISNEAKEILNLQAQWLNNNPDIKITIEGHCDERGTREYNIALGERRAHSAKQYLVSQGVSESRITTVSYGKEKPAFFGNSRAIHAKNRRSVVIERAQ